MTFQIALVLGILATSVVLFVTERFRADVVALLVLGSLAVTGLVTPAEALAGFSNPAVIAVWAMFILSGGLARVGVANVVGHQILRLAGGGEVRLVTVIMLTAALLSAFMNNVGVVALLLPVVMDIARRTRRPPSRLLMPLAFGSLTGGLITLIGTPSNILASDILRDYGLRPFQLFDYAPIGVAVTLVSVAFMMLVGRRLLPERDIARELSSLDETDLGKLYDLDKRMVLIRLPVGSHLAGKSLVESRLGTALGLNVLAIMRGNETLRSPPPQTVLDAGDRLLAEGRLGLLAELRAWRQLVVENDSLEVEQLITADIGAAEVKIPRFSPLVGQTLEEIDFRSRFKVNVLAISHDDTPRRTNLTRIPIRPGDTLLIQGTRAQIDVLRTFSDLRLVRMVSKDELDEIYHLHERLLVLCVPQGSVLNGKTLAESRFGDALDLLVLGIVRNGIIRLMPESEEVLQAGDRLLVQGKREALETLRGLQSLEIEQNTHMGLDDLASERVGLMEAVLSPHTALVGKNLRQLRFREKYGLTVMAIWREGQAYRTNLRDMALRFGDALLLYGPREKLYLLSSEPDFLVLTEAAQEPPLFSKAPLALLIMAAVLGSVFVDWLPISVATVVGATLMVLTGCLNMEEAYRFIDWKAVFLIAGMLPLGPAMERTGAVGLLTQGAVAMTGGLGGLAVVIALFAVAMLLSQMLPNPVVVVLLAPLALNSAADLGLSAHALMMTVAVAAATNFLSPVAHPSNLLVLGPGGYAFRDYARVGLPLTLLTLGVLLLVLPVFWPLVL